jgi:hypothetical protein
LNISVSGSSKRRRHQVSPADGDGISARSGAMQADDNY